MRKILLFILVSIVVLGASGFVLAADTLYLPNPLCLAGTPCVPSPTCICGFPDLIGRITDFILSIIGGVATIMFIWAGILFLTSAGNDARLGTGRKMLFWAVIGIAVAIGGKGLFEVIKNVIGNAP